jgi:ATP-dependent Lon protease
LTDPTGANEFLTIETAQPGDEGWIERPLIPLHGQVIYPNVIAPITLGSARALLAAEHAHKNRITAIGVALRASAGAEPTLEDLYHVGAEIAVGRALRMPDDSHSVLAHGRQRVEIIEFVQTDPFIIVRARPLEETVTHDRKTSALMQTVINLFKRTVDLNDNIPDEVLLLALNAEDPGWLSDLVASTLTLPVDERQQILELLDISQRLRRVASLVGQELSMLELKDEIAGQIQDEMDRSHREVYLREQMRVIQTELGEEDVFQQELDEVAEQIRGASLPPEVHEKAMKEHQRLAMMAPMAPEIGMVTSYIDWLTSIPWNKTTEDLLDVARAQKVLDAEHYGLKKVKDRILEYIAVRKLAPEQRNTPILCFVGPPGVGKTSLGKSIASALGREFVRVSLGGIRDEAEIRGHRRTYIGAMPGRIVQTMRRAGTINPVFMLDEIDKLGMDFRGDPASALLEILDPEQNYAFFDHYLDVPYDLSKVLFITTANELDPLPPALLDRLEVIEFSGYTDEEKIAIARKFLIPHQLEANGLTTQAPQIEHSALMLLIREYTYEAGVRNLNREIANLFRKIARLIAEGKRFPSRVGAKRLRQLLGPPLYDEIRANEQDDVGVATGLAWTPYGGDILTIEVSVLPGKGTLLMTGSLGEVMQESAQAALSYLRSRAEELDVPHDDFEYFDVHVHLPEGAIPKDGPSAGITLAVAIISAFTERKVRADYAMTGEITLRGKVLPVGGVKEKLLAARRARIKHVLLPAQNENDLVEVPKEALSDLRITLVSNMQEVLDHVLGEPAAERRLDKLRREREKDNQDDD